MSFFVYDGSRTVIFIKNGTYKENLTLASTRKNMTIIGQSRDNVKLTYDNYSGKINTAYPGMYAPGSRICKVHF